MLEAPRAVKVRRAADSCRRGVTRWRPSRSTPSDLLPPAGRTSAVLKKLPRIRTRPFELVVCFLDRLKADDAMER